MKRSAIVGVLLLSQAASTACAGQEPPAASENLESNITRAMVAEDARLSRKITIVCRGITIGEVLEQLSDLSGSRLTAGERDGAADVRVAVFCRNVPLSHVLNGVWSTLSYNGALWRWNRTGQPGRYRYELAQPVVAQKLRQKLREWTQRRLESDMKRLMNAAEGSAEEKQAAVHAVFGYDAENKDAGYWGGSLWPGVRAFREALSWDQQRAVLNGKLRFEVPFRQLSKSLQEFYLPAWREATKETHYFVPAADGHLVEQPLPEPDRVRFERVRQNSTPAIYVIIPGLPAAPPFGGSPLETAYRKYLHQLWMLDVDRTADPAADGIMERPESYEPEPEPPIKSPSPRYANPSHPTAEEFERSAKEIELFAREQAKFPPPEGLKDALSRRLEQVSRGARIAVIARLPEDEIDFSLGEPWGLSLTDYWKKLWNLPLMVKWHDGVQIVSAESWPMEDAPAPLWFVRALRREAATYGMLPLTDLTTAADLLTANQMSRLAGEFPVMQAVARFRAILGLLRRNPRSVGVALSEQGLPLTGPVVEALRNSLPSSMMEVVDSGRARFITVRIDNRETPEVRSREVHFQLRSAEGHVLNGISFTDTFRPKPAGKAGKP